MIVPAINYKSEILYKFGELYYTDDMMYETGSLCSWYPNISENPEEGCYDYAVIDSNEQTIGYITYYIDWYSSCASRFGVISFDKGNILMGRALMQILQTLINKYNLHRIEWRMVGGNPIERHYDKICKKYNGKKHILQDVFKDRYGEYHDDVIYEIINKKGGAK